MSTGFASVAPSKFAGLLLWVRYLIPYALGGSAIIFLFLNIGHGHIFNEDYAVYLREAWNIGHRIPLQNMGVIQYDDPSRPLIQNGPLTYPIGVPALFAVPVLIFGYNLYIFKIIQLAFLGFALFSFPAFMRKWRFSTLEICASIIFFSLSYQLRLSINSIGSDIIFIFFLLVALYVIDTVVQKDRPGVGRLVAAGLAIYLCLIVRTVAIMLPVALVLSDFLIHKKIRFLVICIPTVTILFLVGIQNFTGLTGESYGLVMKYRFFTPIENLYQFYWALTAPLANAQVPGWVIALFVGLAISAATAVVYEAYKGQVLATFLMSYTTLLLILPNFDASARYLLPHLLVFGAFAVRGTAILSNTICYGWRLFRFAPAGVATAIVVFTFFVPSPLPGGYWDFGVTSASARELFSFIQKTTPLDSVVAGSKHRSLHLFTGRTTILLPKQPNRLTDWLRDYNVSFVVIKYSEPKVLYDFSDCPKSPFCTGNITSFGAERVFKNSDYEVFALWVAAVPEYSNRPNQIPNR